MIEGTAPSNIDMITINDEDISGRLAWSGTQGTDWEYGPLTLVEGLNVFQIGGFRRNGELLAETTLRILFTDEEPPQISSVYPGEGISVGGENVTIRGTNFQPGLTVTFGDVELPAEDVTRVSTTEITVVTAPHPAGDVVVKVTNSDGLPGFYEYFTYTPIPPPRLAFLVPDRGYTGGGTRVQVRGSYFQPGVRVYFGSTEAPEVVYHGLGELEVVTPARAAGLVSVRVRNVDSQEATLSNAYRYVPDRAPEITGVTPAEGPTGGGTQLTITGDYFENGAVVWIGDNLAAAINVVSQTELTCRTPPGDAGDTYVSVRVENPDGQYAWQPSAFRYANGVMSCNHGDANGDGTVNIADGMAILGRLFQGGGSVRCEAAADFNGDGTIDISDAIAVLSYLFPPDI
jgi:hypothetical protein